VSSRRGKRSTVCLDFAHGLWQKGGVVSQMPRKTPKWLVVAVIGVLVFGAQIALLSAAQLACTATRPDIEGPFYEPNAPERNRTGRGLVVSGTVRSAFDCALLAKARIEWWSASPAGQYDDEHRATQLVASDGRYRYETDFPGN